MTRAEGVWHRGLLKNGPFEVFWNSYFFRVGTEILDWLKLFIVLDNPSFTVYGFI